MDRGACWAAGPWGCRVRCDFVTKHACIFEKNNLEYNYLLFIHFLRELYGIKLKVDNQ